MQTKVYNTKNAEKALEESRVFSSKAFEKSAKNTMDLYDHICDYLLSPL